MARDNDTSIQNGLDVMPGTARVGPFHPWIYIDSDKRELEKDDTDFSIATTQWMEKWHTQLLSRATEMR